MKYSDLEKLYTLEFLEVITKNNYNYKDLLLYNLSNNSNIDFSTINIQNYFPRSDWDWYGGLSKNPKLTLKFVEDNIDMNWNWGKNGLSNHHIITADFLKKYSHKKWNWIELSNNDSIHKNIDLLELFINKPWDWIILSSLDYLPLNFIEKHMDKNWSYNRLSTNKNLTIDFINKYPHKSWNWNYIIHSSHFKFTDIINKLKIEYVELYYFDIIDFGNNMSNHKNLDIEVVKKNINFCWNWNIISQNKNITIETIRNNPNLPWNYHFMTNNPNITFEFVKDNSDKNWDYRKLADNKSVFNLKYKHKWIADTRLKYIAANRIHRFWRDVCFNPLYEYARDRLSKY